MIFPQRKRIEVNCILHAHCGYLLLSHFLKSCSQNLLLRFLPRLQVAKLSGLIFLLVSALSSVGQAPSHPLVRTPQNITANRILPPNILLPGEAMPASFSKEPTDEEIYRVHFFEEPLVPESNKIAVTGESEALLYALAGFSQRTSPDDFSSVLKFLKDYPESRWQGALLANLGIVYRRIGYYVKAMEVWQSAWDLLKNEKEHKIKVLADRVVSELLLMNAWVGRVNKIDSLFKEIDQRIIEGPAVAQVRVMYSALDMMKNDPGISFKCGPYALDKIFTIKDSSHSYSEKLRNVQSSSKGFSLTQLASLSRKVGLNYQMAFREPGSPIIANAVVHWKLGHYSALLKVDSGFINCQDATMGETYGQQFWLTHQAFDSSSSGYFLVPEGPLPNGWRHVGESEGADIFGKGNVPQDQGKHNGDCDMQSGCTSCASQPGNGSTTKPPPMAQSNVHLGTVSLHIFDRPLYYTPPLGPSIDFEPGYHQKDTYQPANFNYSSMGPKWTFNLLSYIQDNPNYQYDNADLYMMGGGVRTFTGFNASISSYAPELQSKDVLVRICNSCYELRHTDGSKEVYARPDGNTSKGRKIFLTEIVDVAGNTVTLSYDSLLRISALQDAIGQVTTLSYGNPANIYEITKITDPFNRSASFEYDNLNRLVKITDMIGIVSSFQYDASDFIQQMTTPYGITSFIKDVQDNKHSFLETHFPMGEKERVEFNTPSPGIAFNEPKVPNGIPVFNQYMNFRNTFFWDKNAMQKAPGDFTKAKVYHWLHGSGATNENGYTAPLLESVRDPLENRSWYYYQGENSAGFANQGMSANPSIIARIMDNGSTQLSKFSYNSLGKVTSSTDPVSRSFTYIYDSTQINLLEVRQTTNGANELLSQYTYNSQHLPLTVKDASGQLTTFTYNSKGQILTTTNAKKETTTFSYDGSGYFTSIKGTVAGATVGFTYDGFGRVRTVTDPEGYTITTDYDALDRPTVITYPDSTYEQIVYDKLDAVQSRDRLGRWTYTKYDSSGRPSQIQDALGRITKFIWCNCGSLSQIIDPLNHLTTFTRDLQGRLIQKIYDDGKSINYLYENTTSRLSQVTDAKGQNTVYKYLIDNNLDSVIYKNAVVATPTVSFTYDPNYNRVATMTDGTGTTNYTYNPVQNTPMLGAGRLAAIDGPLANDVISYTYDSLGRQNGRSINGVASSVVFDALGRVTNATNALGSFYYSYVKQTERLATIAMPNGLKTVFDYFDNKGDQRLKQIWNQSIYGNTLSKFDYEYNAQSQITKWTQQSSGNPPKIYNLEYDSTDQLTGVYQQSDRAPIAIQQFVYRYDAVGNRLMEKANNHVSISSFNSLNQLTQQVSEDSSRNRIGFPGQPGANSLTGTFSYDDNGNMTSATSTGVTYGWDAADRLISITRGSSITEFIYDGLSRRVVEKLNGAVIKRWLWDGTEMVEERDATGGMVAKRFFSQGEQINGIKYYFTKDHLGSVRDVTDGNGILQARYDYDPYGRRTKVFGSIDADFGFTGHYYHNSSGLYLAIYRAYDANLGRWINRDPISERGDFNLYMYVANNPISRVDYFGRDWIDNSWSFFSGFSDIITFGLTDVERDLLGAGQSVNKCSYAYKAGEVLGLVLGLYVGVTELRGALAAWRTSKAAVNLTKSQLKSISSYEGLIAKHEQKLAEYIKDPWKFDNQNVLKNAPNDAIRQKIIEGRIEKLQTEIQTFKNNIYKIINGG